MNQCSASRANQDRPRPPPALPARAAVAVRGHRLRWRLDPRLTNGGGFGGSSVAAGAVSSSTGTTVVSSAFYDRFTSKLVRLLKTALGDVTDKTAHMNSALRGALAGFKDVLLTDSTVVRLHDLLQKSFPACRTNHTQAALKAHVYPECDRPVVVQRRWR
jgi:hypothetical protein